jgi:hypothetical protein
MDNNLINILLKVLSACLIVSYAIYWGALLPTIKKHRKVVVGEWLFPGTGFNFFSYLDEYKQICRKNGYPLIWFKIQWGLYIFMFLSISICFVKIVLL